MRKPRLTGKVLDGLLHAVNAMCAGGEGDIIGRNIDGGLYDDRDIRLTKEEKAMVAEAYAAHTWVHAMKDYRDAKKKGQK